MKQIKFISKNIPRYIFTIIAFLFMGLQFSVFISQSIAQQKIEQNAIDRIKAKGTLTVAIFSEDVEPFFYVDKDKKFIGIDPALAEDIAAKLGVKIQYNRAATTFDGLVDEVVEGRADMVISLLSDTLDRAARVSFSNSYVSVRQFLLINRLELSKLLQSGEAHSTAVTDLLNEKNSRIGVISGTSYVGFVKEDFPAATAIEFAGWDEMLVALKARQLTALMYDEIQIGDWRLHDPAGALELRPYFLEGHPDTISIAIRHSDSDLKDWVNLYLEKAKASNFIKSLLDKYLYSAERSLTHD